MRTLALVLAILFGFAGASFYVVDAMNNIVCLKTHTTIRCHLNDLPETPNL